MRNVKTIPFRLLLTFGATLLLSACKVLPVVPTLAFIPTPITVTPTPPTIAPSPVPTNTPVPTAILTLAATTAIPAASATIGPLPSPVTTVQVTYGPVSLSTIIPSPTLAA